ncbi:MAG: hypothetical protein ACW98F_04130 [Candidatus Hodarchaeales archaeon]|jgi:hypothetical protein
MVSVKEFEQLILLGSLIFNDNCACHIIAKTAFSFGFYNQARTTEATVSQAGV